MKKGGAILLVMIGFVAYLYTGYVKSFLDDETQTTFFIKKHPSLQLRFIDIYANEKDMPSLDKIDADDKKWFADYCYYRFDLTDLEECQRSIPPYLNSVRQK